MVPKIRKGTNKLDKDQLGYLVWGWVLGNLGTFEVNGEPCPFSDMRICELAWRRHRERVIETAKVDPTFKHPAPWAFWAFDAPEPRRQFRGPKPLQPEPLWFGIPQFWRDFEDSKAAVFETEEEYLDRLQIDPLTLQPVGK